MPSRSAEGRAGGHSCAYRRNRSRVRALPLRERLRAARSDAWRGGVADSRHPLQCPHARPKPGSRYSSASPGREDLRRSSRQWISWVLGWRHSLIRYSNPGNSTIGMASGDAGATTPTTIRVPAGMTGECAGIGSVTISTGSPYGRGTTRAYRTPLPPRHDAISSAPIHQTISPSAIAPSG